MDTAFFEYCIFYDDTAMRGSSFTGEAVFAEAVFLAEANFSDITCEADADFDSCSFYGNYRSDESEYEGAVGFTNVLFLGDVDFAGARFTGDAPSFDEAVFAPGVLTRLPHKNQPSDGHQHPDTAPAIELTQAPAGGRRCRPDPDQAALPPRRWWRACERYAFGEFSHRGPPFPTNPHQIEEYEGFRAASNQEKVFFPAMTMTYRRSLILEKQPSDHFSRT